LKSNRWIFRKNWKKRLLIEAYSVSNAQLANSHLKLGSMVL